VRERTARRLGRRDEEKSTRGERFIFGKLAKKRGKKLKNRNICWGGKPIKIFKRRWKLEGGGSAGELSILGRKRFGVLEWGRGEGVLTALGLGGGGGLVGCGGLLGGEVIVFREGGRLLKGRKQIGRGLRE